MPAPLLIARAIASRGTLSLRAFSQAAKSRAFSFLLIAGSCLYPTSTISRSLARSLAPFAGTNLPTLPSPNGGIPL